MHSAQLRVDSQGVATDGCTTIIPTFPVFRKVTSRYVLRCRRKRRQVITFSSSNYHGQKTTARNWYLPGNTVSSEGMEVLVQLNFQTTLSDNYSTFYHFTNGVAKDFGRVGCRRSARKYVTVKGSLSSSPMSAKSLRSGEFNLFPNFNKVWSTSIARGKHRTI